MGFGVYGLGFTIWCLGFRIKRVVGFRVRGLGVMV